jgi:hypothetical protein
VLRMALPDASSTFGSPRRAAPAGPPQKPNASDARQPSLVTALNSPSKGAQLVPLSVSGEYRPR